MKICFTKMQGIGNDYIYVNCLDGELPDPCGVAVQMSPRHYSVGSDGLIMICPSQVADAKMRMFNADGTEGKMCGNAIRCVGKYLYDNRITDKTQLTIETLGGIKTLYLNVENGKVDTVRVDMEAYSIEPGEIPISFGAPMIDEPVIVDGKEYRLTAVSMGNPHAVAFLPEIQSLDLEKIGPLFEHHRLFPDRVNTEFAHVIDEKTIEMRVWERGSGETYACGTGSCATVVAAVLNGYCKAGQEVTVKLIGGDLKILVQEDHRVFMTGKAKTVYEGVYDYEPEVK
jgi:diaminopimelate epimerase